MNTRRRPLYLCLGGLGLIITLSVHGQGLRTDPERWNTFVAQALRIIEELEKQELSYSRQAEDLRDCSGIFHQVLNRLRNSCAGFEGPGVDSARSTRTVAAWYADKNRLTIVRNSLRQDDLIEPGMVFFYGDQDKKYRNMTKKKALAEIRHLGIVVAVHRNADGDVESYRLFHGRSPGKHASVSYHGRHPRRKSDPALGNGNQQWLAATRLCRGDTCRCAARTEG